MDFNGLRLDYALEGSSKYISWKDRMEVVLEYNGLKEFINEGFPKPDARDAANIDAWKNTWKIQGGCCWGEYETTLSEASMGKPHHMKCGRL